MSIYIPNFSGKKLYLRISLNLKMEKEMIYVMNSSIRILY